MKIQDGKKLYTVKEAAELTNYSVPYFYSETGRERLGVAKGTIKKGWLISEEELIFCGMLNPSGQPVRDGVKNNSQSLEADIDELHNQLDLMNQKLIDQGQELYEERLEKTKLEAELVQKDAQIKMLRELFVEIKGKD
jgi:hypothetical protein